MRVVKYIFMILISILIFGAVNYYIGLRELQRLNAIPFINNRVYWIIFWILAFSYVAARVGEKYLPSIVEDYLNLIGSYWMGALLYLIIILPILDIVSFAGRKISFIPVGIKDNVIIRTSIGVLILLSVAGILIYGTINAKNIRVNHYDININKKAGSLNELHVVMISDAHLGSIVDNSRLAKMVEKINDLKPDLIIMAGDIVDEKLFPFVKQNMGETLKKLKARYGVYAATGNHEYYGGEVEGIIKNLEAANIKVLKDEYIEIDNSIYIAGREDIVVESYYKRKRKTLEKLLDGVDKSLPIILIDHNPKNLQEPESNGVDLQLSGHTHRGQMFPNQFVTQRLYEIDYGYLKKGDLNVVVSSGVGTWGPPIRIGNNSEIVDITLTFKK